jgi:hypothetical protein
MNEVYSETIKTTNFNAEIFLQELAATGALSLYRWNSGT